MFKSALLGVLALTFAATAAHANCEAATYRGVNNPNAIIKFLTKESGVIFLAPDVKFDFTTEISNGVSREYLTLQDVPGVKDDITSVVMPLQTDLKRSLARGASPILILPDLHDSFFNATRRDEKLSALNKIDIDDTYRLVSCDR